MRERKVFETLENLRKKNGTPKSTLCEKAGWNIDTYREAKMEKTSLSLLAVSDFFNVYGYVPAILDENGNALIGIPAILSYIKNHVEYLDVEKKNEIYRLCSSRDNAKYGKQNFRKYMAGECSIRLRTLIPILDILGAEFVIVYISDIIYR